MTRADCPGVPDWLAEQVARVERMNEETHRYVVEAHKLHAEQHKRPTACPAVAPEPPRSWLLGPIALLTAIACGWAASFAAGAAFVRMWGGR